MPLNVEELDMWFPSSRKGWLQDFRAWVSPHALRIYFYCFMSLSYFQSWRWFIGYAEFDSIILYDYWDKYLAFRFSFIKCLEPEMSLIMSYVLFLMLRILSILYGASWGPKYHVISRVYPLIMTNLVVKSHDS